MKHIGYILERFPSLTERFILRELEELHQRGIRFKIFALGKARLPTGESIPSFFIETVIYARHALSLGVLSSQFSFLVRAPERFFATIWFIIKKNISKPRNLASSLRHFPHAVYFAGQMERFGIEHIHAHFAGLPTTLALIIFKLLKLDFSFSAHAWDLYVSRVMFSDKFHHAKFVITCNNFNHEYIMKNTGGKYSQKIHTIYHGLDIEKYSKIFSALRPDPNHELFLREKDDDPFLLSIGRLEAKKGFPYLLDACRLLKSSGKSFRCVIVGEGREKEALASQIRDLGLDGIVILSGALSEETVMGLYALCDIFILPCITAQNGDHDGLPNVLLEASAMETAVISTRVGGIPELIENDKTGLLVPEKNPEALASAVETLIKDKEKRNQLAKNGREKVSRLFNIQNNIDPIIELFNIP